MSQRKFELSADERRFLLSSRVARLATVDAHGDPHVIPVVYALCDDEIYMVVDDKPKRTKTKLKRLVNIAAHPRVALLVDHYSEDWNGLAYLLIRGRAAIIADAVEYGNALRALRERYPQYCAMLLELGTHPMVRITIEWLHYWSAAEDAQSTTPA